MTKKLLVLIDSLGEKKELFAESILKRFPEGFSLSLARFLDLSFEVKKGSVSIFIDSLGIDIGEFDMVYFRRAGNTYSVMAMNVAISLQSLDVKFIDSAWGEMSPMGSKLTSLIKLAVSGLPVIPSYYCWETNIKGNQPVIIEKLGFPLVAKELGSQLGKGVYLIKNEEDFAGLPQKYEGRSTNNQYLFQKFIEKVDEYRLLVLGSKVAVAEKKIATTEGEFRNNVALGAREEFLDVSELSNEVKEIAVGGAKALGIEIAGVDIAIDKTGQPWLLEVNRGPGLTYDTKVSPEIDELAKFFKEELDKTR